MTKSDLLLDDRPMLRRGVRLGVDPLSGRSILLFPEGVLMLNETAARIVEHCNGGSTVNDVVNMLRPLYAGVRADDVIMFLADLVEQRLLARHG